MTNEKRQNVKNKEWKNEDVLTDIIYNRLGVSAICLLHYLRVRVIWGERKGVILRIIIVGGYIKWVICHPDMRVSMGL
jgi:hypothetical protein